MDRDSNPLSLDGGLLSCALLHRLENLITRNAQQLKLLEKPNWQKWHILKPL
jgi:hypothetical protein